MFRLALIGILLLSPLSAFGLDTTVSADKRIELYNLEDQRLALHGYDPVSYFQSGPAKGKQSITTTYNGVLYQFANAENKATFLAHPDKYEPAYGGWCAWAMINGKKADINPNSYKIVDGKLYVFYKTLLTNTLSFWNKKADQDGDAKLIEKADLKWGVLLKQ